MERIHTVCASHCGGVCPLVVHVDGGKARRIETDSENRACLRGRAYRQRLYAPDRILHPLKRTGPRGSGEFKRISWDEALDTVATELKRVKDKHGPTAIASIGSGGDIVQLHSAGLVETLLARFGGFSGTWGMHSAEGAWFASQVTYGALASGNTRDDFINSRLILLWGWNPAVTVSYGMTAWHLIRAREAGAKIVSIDPRYTNTAAVLDAKWIPIRPGTDTAMLVAMAYVIVTEKLYDRSFLDRYTTGFDRFKSYVTGAADGTPKTPDWAAEITGVPVAKITGLAREYAGNKPSALMDGIAAGRTAFGEQFHRAAAALTAMTGNVGIPGGNAAGFACLGARLPFISLGLPVAWRLKGNANPVEKTAGVRPLGRYSSIGGPSAARISRFRLADAILKGKNGGYPADIKFLYVTTCNYLNQCSNTNNIAAALKSLEFMVIHEQFMTATARYADIIFPASTFMERNDVCAGGIGHFYAFQNRVVPPQGESRSHFEICCALAKRLGITGFSEKKEEEWLNEIISGCADLPSYEIFKSRGFHKLKLEKPYVLFEKNISDPSANPFPTPTGKIEIFSQALADIGDPLLPPVPQYVEPWEGRNDSLAKRYPLQLITTHTLRRAHSTFETLPWLRELYPHELSMNPVDARPRGIKDGGTVRVFNNRGRTTVRVKFTERLMPGVVDLPQGAWFKPGDDGIDRGGCANVLTRDVISPGGSFPSNTALVQVEAES
jgi:anaerobic dimethyl sulfoxide reductase subunit A